jgi:uncharacterized protein YlxW (UPF0749 family)
MTIERHAQNTDAAFAEKVRERILVWIKIVGDAPNSLFIQLRRMATSIRKSTWVVLAIVLAGNIIAFNYYQERITRYYFSVLLTNIVRINEDIDTLQAKVNQLNQKIDNIDAKLDKPVLPSSSSSSRFSSSNLAKSRGR